jgi:hypothetical protein
MPAINKKFSAALCRSALLGILIWLISFGTHAFPPVPHHTLFGSVRDAMGNPLVATNATVIFEPSTGVSIDAAVIPYLRPGVSYELMVPMDAGLTPQLYKRTAQFVSASFRLRVQIGNTTYLPLEMTGNLLQLGLPSKSTRLDLTVGIDSDGNGIPDAWERAIMSALGLTEPFRPGDTAPNGMTYYANYVAGTYPFDPADGFKLTIAHFRNGVPQIDFLAIRGRLYTLYGSTDTQTWVPVSFKVPAEGASAVTRSSYQAADLQQLRIEIVQPGENGMRFFKMRVQ